ncbi:HIRP3 protein, partial [Atractosteus spatula]|nr:HIRP3 protein [Atractosteus spatula]
EEHKSISRLKRYVALCGVRRNYKRLFEGCKSVRSKVNVLRQQLEDLGVKGQIP